MAGDWIKMRSDLAEDPAVICIAGKVGIDEFSVVGRLQYLWAWFDAQSRDGHAHGVTEAWVNRKVQCDGFAQAMAEAGWLVVHPHGLEIPNFDRHNGDTAKTRALGTKRKQKERSKEDGHANVSNPSADASRSQRDKSETREEKRREEKKESVGAEAPAAPKPASRGQRLAGDWSLPQEWGDWALTEFPQWTTEKVRLEAAKFADHWRSKTGKDAAKADWQATWRNWCRSDIAHRDDPKPDTRSVTVPSAETVEQYQARMVAERAAAREGITKPPAEALALAAKLRLQ